MRSRTLIVTGFGLSTVWQDLDKLSVGMGVWKPVESVESSFLARAVEQAMAAVMHELGVVGERVRAMNRRVRGVVCVNMVFLGRLVSFPRQ